MNFVTPVRSIKEFFQIAMFGAALMIGWSFIGGKILFPVLNAITGAVWGAITRMI